MSDQLAQRARNIVQQILYVTVATVSVEGKPWNSPVYASFDDAGNFYWVSSPEAQHSQNVERNGEAFLVVYNSTVPWATGEGVYIEAGVSALNDLDEIAEARRNLALRVGKPLDDQHAKYLEGGVRRVYRAVPKRVWMNHDEKDAQGEYIRTIRVEIPLRSLCNLTTW